MAPNNRLQFIIDVQDGKVKQSVNDVSLAIQHAGQQADKTSGKTERLNKSLKRTSKEGLLTGDAIRNVAGSLSIVQGPLGPVAGRLNALGAVMGRLNVAAFGVTAALTAAGVTLTKGLQAAAAYESQMLKVNAVIKSTGGAALLSAGQIDQFAVQLGEATLTSADKVREAAVTLMSFRTISGETFKETLRLAQDLSASGFGDLSTSTKQLGKALEDPVRGLARLRQAGLIFRPEQEALIKGYAKSGELLKAQNAILEEVRRTVGGSGAGAAGGLTGAMDTLGERMTRLLEGIGSYPAIFEPAIDVVTSLSEKFGLLADVMDVVNRKGEVGLAVRQEDLRGQIASLDMQVKKMFDLAEAQGREGVSSGNVTLNGLIAKRLELEEQLNATIREREILKGNIVEGTAVTPGPEADPGAQSRFETQLKAQQEFYDKLRAEAQEAGKEGLALEEAQHTEAVLKANERYQTLYDNAQITQEQQRQLEADHLTALADLQTAHAARVVEIKQKEADKLQKIQDKVDAAALDAQIARQQTLADRIEEEQAFYDELALMAATAAESKEVQAITEFDRELERIEQSREVLLMAGFTQEEIEAEIRARREAAEAVHWAKIGEIRTAEDERAYQAASDQAKFFMAVRDGDLKNATAMGAKLTAAAARESRAAFEANKVFSAANALIQGYENAVAAYGMGLKTGIPGAAETFAAISAAFTAAQIQGIMSTTFSGGGGAAGAVSVPSAQLSEPPAPPAETQPSIYIDIIQTGNGTEFIDTKVIPRIQDQVLNADVQIVNVRSRNAQDIRGIPA